VVQDNRSRECDFCWRPRDLLLLAAFGVSAFALYWGAWHPWWYNHAVVDPIVYWNRAGHYFNAGWSWHDLGLNEYPPGALWFFALVMLISGTEPLEYFLGHLMVFNILLLGVHIFLARIFVSERAAWVMLFLGVLVGPILLHRFELLVSLLVLCAWLRWRAGNFGWGAFFLGLATATKVYPLLLAPLLGVAALRKKGFLGGAQVLAAWVAGVTLPAGLLYLGGSNLGDMVSSFRFHLDKPFGVEGLLGSGIPIMQWLAGIPLRMAPRNGVHGFDVDLPAGSAFAMEWLWLPVILAMLWGILRLPRSEYCASAPALFVLFGWYVLLGKLTTPQYAWWALPFLALTPREWMPQATWRGILFLVTAALLGSQVVYPVFYSEFLQEFAGNPLEGRIFWINAIKNLLWLVVLSVMTWQFVRHIKQDLEP
jgi:hypothetical protein